MSSMLASVPRSANTRSAASSRRVRLAAASRRSGPVAGADGMIEPLSLRSAQQGRQRQYGVALVEGSDGLDDRGRGLMAEHARDVVGELAFDVRWAGRAGRVAAESGLVLLQGSAVMQ